MKPSNLTKLKSSSGLRLAALPLVATALIACKSGDDPSSSAADQEQGTPAEVASAVAPLPEKAQELRAALGTPASPAPDDGGCGSPGGCRSTSSPMMMPMPGSSMMGIQRAGAAPSHSAGQDEPMPSGNQAHGMQMAPSAGNAPGAMNMGTAVAAPTSSGAMVHQVGASEFFLDQATALELSIEQQQTLGAIRQRAFEAVADADRQVAAAEEALWSLTAADRPDITKIRAEVERSAQVTARRRADFIMAVAEAAKVLTPSQLAVLSASSDQSSAQSGTGTGAMKMGSSPSGSGGGMNMGNNSGDGMNMGHGMKQMKMGNQQGSSGGGMNMGSDSGGGMKMGMGHGMKQMKMGNQQGSSGGGMKMGMGHGMDQMKMGNQQGSSGGGMNMGSNPGGGMNMEQEMGLGMMGRDPSSAARGIADVSASLPGFPGRSHLYHVGATGFFLDHDDHVQLTDAQRADLARIKSVAQNGHAEVLSRIAAAEHDLYVVTSADGFSREAVDAGVRRIAALYVERRLAFIQAVGQAASVLTNAQRRALVGTASALQQAHGTGNQTQ